MRNTQKYSGVKHFLATVSVVPRESHVVIDIAAEKRAAELTV